MMIDASADMLIDIKRMDREDPSIRYRSIICALPRMLARGSTYEGIERSYGITILPEHRLPMTAASE